MTDSTNKPPSSGWSRVDNAVVDHLPELSGAAVKVYLVLAKYADDDRTCYPGLGHVAKAAGISRATAKRSIAQLIEAGLVEKMSRCAEGGFHDTNLYRLLSPGGRVTSEPTPPTRVVHQRTQGRVTSEPTPPTRVVHQRTQGRVTSEPGVGSPVTPKQDPKTKTQEQDKRSRANGSYSKAFEAFWSHYPRKTAKKKAFSAYRAAVKAIRTEHGCEPADAHQRLLAAVQAFQASDKGKGDKQFIPYPATFLNEGRYDDDPAEWRETRSGTGKTRSGGPVRQTDSVARPKQRYGGA